MKLNDYLEKIELNDWNVLIGNGVGDEYVDVCDVINQDLNYSIKSIKVDSKNGFNLFINLHSCDYNDMIRRIH